MATDYLEAHPGFEQKIKSKIYLVKWMYSNKSDALDKIQRVESTRTYEDVVLYIRKINGKLFGKHPYCVAVRKKNMVRTN
jgi:hypothetical protein